MTNNDDLYHELLKAGAPELPKGYYYKFSIGPKRISLYDGTEHKESRSLFLAIRKKVCGGLFSTRVNSWYWSRQKLHRYAVDVDRLIRRGWITEDQIDGTYHLAHMALLAEDANKDRIEKEEKAKARKKKEPDLATRRISAFLNKRLP